MGLMPWSQKQKEALEGESSSPLSSLRSEMDRLFDSFLREPLGSLDWRFGVAKGCSPALDMAVSDTEVTIRAEVPGVDPADLDITVSGRQLVLAGEKKESADAAGRDFLQAETRYGSFRRIVPLPEAVDMEQVEADYTNGVLTIHLKKSVSTPPKRVDVKVK